jgi:hypothetical protein
VSVDAGQSRGVPYHITPTVAGHAAPAHDCLYFQVAIESKNCECVRVTKADRGMAMFSYGNKSVTDSK